MLQNYHTDFCACSSCDASKSLHLPYPQKPIRLKRNRKKEELYNVLTHGTGAVLSVLALLAMVYFSALRGTRMQLLASLIFGMSLTVLYTASTVYHAMTRLSWKRIFQIVDHLCIYLLIAGTYTPIALLGLKGATPKVIEG